MTVAYQGSNSSGGGTTTASVTFDNTGTGAASGTTFNGSVAVEVSYNTLGAQAALVSGTNIKTVGGVGLLGAGDVSAPAFASGQVSATPVNPTDLVNKAYSDATAQGLSTKASVQHATAAALPTNTYNNGTSGVGATLTGTVTGVLTVDGVAVALNDRVLVKNEVAGANNGIYLCTLAGAVGVAYVLTRALDSNTAADLEGAFCFVEQGTANAATGWVNTNAGVVTIGTTALTYTQFSGAGTYSAGTGLALSGSTFSLTTPVAAANGGLGVAAGSAANGALPIGNGSGFTLATLSAGSNVTITNTAGSITINSTAGAASTTTLSASPGTPSSGSVTLGTIPLGGREMLALQPAHGSQKVHQDHIGRGSWGLVQGSWSGTTMTYSGNFVAGLFTSTGNTSSQSYANTNYGTYQPRQGFTSSGTAGNYAGIYQNVGTVSNFVIGGSNLGGGTFIARFMIGDTVTAPLMFVGLGTNVGAPSATTDPAALTQVIGIGVSQTATNPNNLHIFFTGSGSQTGANAPIDLGSNFPANTSQTDFYEFILFSDPITGQVGYTVNRYTSSVLPANTASGTLANATPGTTLPSASLACRAWRSNNGTGAATTFSLQSMYLAGMT